MWALPLQGSGPDARKPFLAIGGPFDERNGAFSPDGRWLAYQSNESTQYEIYLRPFPPTAEGTQILVSTAGGIQTRWHPNGRELYFIAPDGTLMAASITMKGGSVDVGTPTTVFKTKMLFGGVNRASRKQYDVAPDGRFLIYTLLDDATVSPITIIQNWAARE